MTLLAAAATAVDPALELLPAASEGGPFKFLTGGGVVGVIILLLSLGAAGLSIALFVRIRANVLVPSASIEALREMLEHLDPTGKQSAWGRYWLAASTASARRRASSSMARRQSKAKGMTSCVGARWSMRSS